MFHVELRQFPHQGRAFNLDRVELERRVLEPWMRGEKLELQEQRFDPEKAKLAIYEGRELELTEIGLGRGWANVTRTGADVTERLLREAGSSAALDLDRLKVALLERASGGPLTIADALETGAGEANLVRDALWQLLSEGELTLTRRS